MLKACETILKNSAENKIVTFFSDLSETIIDCCNSSSGKINTELEIEIEKEDEKVNIQFFHDFYYYDENIISNNCYHEEILICSSLLSDPKLLLNWLHFNNCFVQEVQELLKKAFHEKGNDIFFDGEILDIYVEGNTYPILMIHNY